MQGLELQRQYHAGEAEGDGVGEDDGQAAKQQAVEEPESDTQGKEAVHAQRDAGEVAAAPGFECLGDEGQGGEAGGAIADDFLDDWGAGHGLGLFWPQSP